MATSDDGKLNKALDAIAALPSAPASAEPVVNAAAMAALQELAEQVEARWIVAADEVNLGQMSVVPTWVTDLLDRFTVRELGGEVRDGE